MTKLVILETGRKLKTGEELDESLCKLHAWTPQIGQDYCRHHRRIIEGAARDEKLKAERHKAKRPTLIFFAQSKYDGYCRDKDCGGRWSKGEACYWDSQTREVFCVECGELMSPY